jgi:hypothetical protein
MLRMREGTTGRSPGRPVVEYSRLPNFALLSLRWPAKFY